MWNPKFSVSRRAEEGGAGLGGQVGCSGRVSVSGWEVVLGPFYRGGREY